MWRRVGRALVAVVALTCTFHRALTVHSQLPAQRFMHIQDLICVMIQNGVQKEDLDETILKELQKYDVNLGELKNEALQSLCLESQRRREMDTILREISDNANKNNTFVVKDLDAKFMSLVTTMASESKPVTPIEQSSNTMSLIKFITQQAPVNTTTPTTTITEQNPIVITRPSIVENWEEKMQKFYNLLMKNRMTPYINTTTTEQTTTMKAKVDNILENLLQTYKNKFNTKSDNEIRLFLSEYMKHMQPTTEYSTTLKPTVPPAIVTSHLKNLIPLIFPYANNKKQSIIDTDFIIKHQFQEIPETPNNNGAPNNIDPIINTGIKVAGRYVYMPPNDNTNIPIQTKMYEQPIYSFNNYQPIKELNSNKKEGLASNGNNIKSLDSMKQISDSIRNMVMEDLKKRLCSSITKMVTITEPTTTEATTISQFTAILPTTTQLNIVATSPPNNPELRASRLDAKRIEPSETMYKILELLEELKSMKQNTALPSTNYNTPKTKNTNYMTQPFNMPQNRIISRNPFSTGYNIINEPIITSKINPYVSNTQVERNSPKLIKIPNDKNVLKIITSRHKPIIHINGLSNAPITIQTNSEEIPPIVVPKLSRSNIVNQNIVVTTAVPISKIYDRQRVYNRMFELNDNAQKEKTKLNILYTDWMNEGHTKTFRRSELENTNHRDGVNYRNIDNNPQNRFYWKQEPMPVRYRLPKSIQNNEQRMDDRGNARETANQRKVSVLEREQIPLPKKTTVFDDANFRKFLVTQQKVNNILERILARQNRPAARSVEVIT